MTQRESQLIKDAYDKGWSDAIDAMERKFTANLTKIRNVPHSPRFQAFSDQCKSCQANLHCKLQNGETDVPTIDDLCSGCNAKHGHTCACMEKCDYDEDSCKYYRLYVK